VWALSISLTIISAISAIKQDYELAMDPKNKVFREEFIEVYRQNICLCEVIFKDYSNKMKRNHFLFSLFFLLLDQVIALSQELQQLYFSKTQVA
jgi:hypothetical protein